jgi:hypothetical protein
MILYAVEFMLHRGTMTSDAADKFVKCIKQDHNKLEASRDPFTPKVACPGFVENFQTIAFYEDSSQNLILKSETDKLEHLRLQLGRIAK